MKNKEKQKQKKSYLNAKCTINRQEQYFSMFARLIDSCQNELNIFIGDIDDKVLG
jgi:hypothetical protein